MIPDWGARIGIILYGLAFLAMLFELKRMKKRVAEIEDRLRINGRGD